jgi:hypothetical protein
MITIVPSTRDLVARLADLLRSERTAMADFLIALAELDRLKGWRDLGHSGLFPFLRRELGLSKAAAFFRMKAAILIQRFPEIIEPLKDGRLCITSVAELAKVLTAENRETVLPRFFHCSKQEAKQVSAELAPVQSPPQRAVVTAMSKQAGAPPSQVTVEIESQTVRLDEPLRLDAEPTPGSSARPTLRDTTDPLTADLSRLHVTVSRGFLEKLERARMALSHSIPGATIEGVLEAGLNLVLAKDAKKKALVARPGPTTPANQPTGSDSRYIPAEIRRVVWDRDQGKCQWPLHCGGICGSTLRPELDHIRGWKPGEPVKIEDLRVLCDFHNDLAAREVYGDDYMDSFRRRRPRRSARGNRGASP